MDNHPPIHVETFRDVADHLEDFHSRLSQVEHVQSLHSEKLATIEDVMMANAKLVDDIEQIRDGFYEERGRLEALETRFTGHLGTITSVVLRHAADFKQQKALLWTITAAVGIIIVLNVLRLLK